MMRLDSIEKILQHSQADVARFFRVKLDTVHLSTLDRAGERYDVRRHDRRLVSDWRRVRVRRLHLRPTREAFEQSRRARKLELVPADVRNSDRPLGLQPLAMSAHQRQPFGPG